jgi:hypothetical protein
MNRLPINRCISEGLKFLVVLGVICVPVLRAQETPNPRLPAPPPLRVIPRQDRAQLGAAKDVKARLRKTIELAQIHLQHAEQFTAEQRFEEALTELGGYAGLIEDALHFIGEMNHERVRTRDLYRHLELNLRADGPRLTSMRRVTPLEYAIRIKELEDFARDGRAEALDSFYTDTILRDGNKKKSDDEKPKPSGTRPESKQP